MKVEDNVLHGAIGMFFIVAAALVVGLFILIFHAYGLIGLLISLLVPPAVLYLSIRLGRVIDKRI